MLTNFSPTQPTSLSDSLNYQQLISGTKICYYNSSIDQSIKSNTFGTETRSREVIHLIPEFHHGNDLLDQQHSITSENNNHSNHQNNENLDSKYNPDYQPAEDFFLEDSSSRSPIYTYPLDDFGCLGSPYSSPKHQAVSALSPIPQISGVKTQNSTQKQNSNISTLEKGKSSTGTHGETSNSKIPIRKKLLTDNSPYFAAMFSGNFSDTNKKEINILYSSYKSLNYLMHIISGCKNCNFTMIDESFDYNTIMEIMELANRFLLNKNLVNFIESNLIHVFQNQEADLDFYWDNFFGKNSKMSSTAAAGSKSSKSSNNCNNLGNQSQVLNEDRASPFHFTFTHLNFENGVSYFKKFILMKLMKKSLDSEKFMKYSFNSEEIDLIVGEFLDCFNF